MTPPKAEPAEAPPLWVMLWSGFAWLAAIGIAASSVYGAVHYSHALPYADQWDLLKLPGERRFADYLRDLWAVHVDHRLVLFRLINAVDYAAFGYRNHFNIAAIVVTMTVNVALLVALLRRGGADRRTMLLWIAPATLALGFNGAQSENLTWALGLQWHLANAFFLASLLAAVPAAGAAPRTRHVAASLGCAILATLSAANGLLVWPLLVLYALWSRFPARLTGIYLATGISVIAFYLTDMPQHVEGSALLSTLINAPGAILAYTARFVAHFWYYTFEPYPFAITITATIGYCVFAGLAIASIAVLTGRLRPGPAGRAAAIVIMFAMGTGVLAALGRAETFGPGQAAAPRYGSVSWLLWAGILGWTLTSSPKLHPQVSKILAPISVAVPLLAIVFYQPQMLRTLAEWHRGQELAALALIVGVEDEQVLRRTFPPDSSYPIQQAVGLRAAGKSIFGESRASYMLKHIRGDFARQDGACLGAGERLESVTQLSGGALVNHRAFGWAWDREMHAPVTTLLLVDERGQVVGLASAGAARTDILQANPEVTDPNVGWTGFILPVTGLFTAFALVGKAPQKACLL